MSSPNTTSIPRSPEEHSSSAPHSPVGQASTWSDFAVQDAVAKLRHNSGAAAIAEMMNGLAAMLSNIREYEKWDPRAMGSIVPKSGYRVLWCRVLWCVCSGAWHF